MYGLLNIFYHSKKLSAIRTRQNRDSIRRLARKKLATNTQRRAKYSESEMRCDRVLLIADTLRLRSSSTEVSTPPSALEKSFKK